MRQLIKPRIEGYEFLSFAKYIGKYIGESISKN